MTVPTPSTCGQKYVVLSKVLVICFCFSVYLLCASLAADVLQTPSTRLANGLGSVLSQNEPGEIILGGYTSPSQRAHGSIATCVTGKLRSLVNEEHRENFLRAFYYPLRGFEVDTYFNLDSTSQTDNTDVLKALNHYFKPVDISIVTVECKSAWCNDSECISSGFSQFKRMELCMDKVESQERRMNFRYDFVIRLRPDLLFRVSLPKAECWLNLRRDVVWDSDTLFYGDQSRRVRSALEVDFLIDTFKILPRDLATNYMKGVARTYENCIPEVDHVDNIASGGDQVLSQLFGDKFTGGCGKNNIRWRWNECRALVTLQMMNVSVGRLQEPSLETGRGSDLCRCSDPQDVWCRNTTLQLTGEPFGGEVTSRSSCFPDGAYYRGPHSTHDASVQRGYKP